VGLAEVLVSPGAESVPAAAAVDAAAVAALVFVTEDTLPPRMT
jgi:hypothetical protein